MNKKSLGNQELQVSTIGLGCMGMSANYGAIPDKNKLIFKMRFTFEKTINKKP